MILLGSFLSELFIVKFFFFFLTVFFFFFFFKLKFVDKTPPIFDKLGLTVTYNGTETTIEKVIISTSLALEYIQANLSELNEESELICNKMKYWISRNR